MAVSEPGASFVQVVEADTNTRDFTGMCLRFAQSVFGAPARHRSATDAANATKFRHHTREMPNVAALVWFDHYGTYQNEYANWGHVLAWVPGAGFLSSPPYAKYDANGNQIPWSQWYPSIDAVERAFNAKFRFWTEDINDSRVAEPAPHVKAEEETMLTFIASHPNGTWYVTDGLTKRPIAPGENQMLVDLGQAKYVDKPGRVNLVSPVQLARIPDQNSALPLDTAGIVAEVVEAIKATGVTVDVDVNGVAEAVLRLAAERLAK